MLYISHINFILFYVFFCFLNIDAQPSERKISRTEYINMFSEEAINQMLKHKIPASITMAQGILESGNGNSKLAKYAKNHFGIKCHEWEGDKIYQDDDKKNDCFRKYPSVIESFEDHSLFLKKHNRYSFLFDLNIKNYKGWAKGLKKAGYATNPKYPQLLISIIEDYKLHELDQSHPFTNIYEKIRNKNNATILYEPTMNVHVIKIHENKIKYVQVNKGDTFYKIAKEFEMGLWQLYKYNDLNKHDILKAGDILFLQPKRSKAKTNYHIFNNGDSMRALSQFYGIKLNKLYKKNKMPFGSNANIGDKIYLRKSKK